MTLHFARAVSHEQIIEEFGKQGGSSVYSRSIKDSSLPRAEISYKVSDFSPECYVFSTFMC